MCINGSPSPSYFIAEQPLSVPRVLQQDMIMQEETFFDFDGLHLHDPSDIIHTENDYPQESLGLYQHPSFIRIPSVQQCDSRSTLEETKSEPQSTSSDHSLSTTPPAFRP